MRVYLGGPMRGYDIFNWPAFEKAAAELRAAGHEVVSPAEIDEEAGWVAVYRNDEGVAVGVVLLPAFGIEKALARDFAAIDGCEGVVFLAGWEQSEGCGREWRHAISAGVPCWTFDEFLAGKVTA